MIANIEKEARERGRREKVNMTAFGIPEGEKRE